MAIVCSYLIRYALNASPLLRASGQNKNHAHDDLLFLIIHCRIFPNDLFKSIIQRAERQALKFPMRLHVPFLHAQLFQLFSIRVFTSATTYTIHSLIYESTLPATSIDDSLTLHRQAFLLRWVKKID